MKKQCFCNCWLFLAIANHDVTHFGCLNDNLSQLIYIIQTVLVIRIYLFTRLQNATEVDTTCLLPPDLVVAT